MKKNNKKNVKIVALMVAVMFILGIVGIAVTQTQTGYAAPADKNSAIGYIDIGKAMQSHPDAEAAMKTLQAESEAFQKDFDEKAKTLSEQEQQRYYVQLQQRLQQKEAELTSAIFKKIEASVQKVAKAKGLSVIVERGSVVYGGTDITDDVIKDFGKK